MPGPRVGHPWLKRVRRCHPGLDPGSMAPPHGRLADARCIWFVRRRNGSRVKPGMAIGVVAALCEECGRAKSPVVRKAQS